MGGSFVACAENQQLSPGQRPLVGSSKGHYLSLRLRPGQDLRLELSRLCQERQIQAASVITCVGSLERVTLRMANQSTTTEVPGPLEIVSLVGTMGQAGLHLHLAVADREGRVIGGHLVDGSAVFTTAEITVVILEDLQFLRTQDSQTGSRELDIRSIGP